MREILFRGKHNGEWVYGSFASAPRKALIYEISESIPTRMEGKYVDIKTVGQYTGLTDKNGKKIFEGDVFRLEDEMVGIIIFKDGCFRLQVWGLCGTFTESGYDECGGGWGLIECEPMDWYNLHDMEIIGNIHDNPELLKGE